MSKYKSKRVEYDGIMFDSKAEAEYYMMLMELKDKGEIKSVICHPKYELIPKFRKNMAIKYISDFEIEYSDGKVLVVDVKGMATETAKIKRKMFDYFHRDKELIWVVKNIKHGNEYGFIEYNELEKIRRENRKKKKAQ